MKTTDSSRVNNKGDRVEEKRPPWIQVHSKGVVLCLRIVPRSSRNALQGERGELLKICLQAPPQDGKANAALIKFLSDLLEVPKRQIDMLSGATGRNKRILIQGGEVLPLLQRISHAME